MYNSKEKAIIFIDGFINLEYKHKRAIINLYDNIEELFDNPKPALNYLKQNLSDNACNLFKLALNEDYINELFNKYHERGITIVTEESQDYPSRLLCIDFNPLCLYLKGDAVRENFSHSVGFKMSTAPVLCRCFFMSGFQVWLTLPVLEMETKIICTFSGNDLF